VFIVKWTKCIAEFRDVNKIDLWLLVRTHIKWIGNRNHAVIIVLRLPTDSFKNVCTIRGRENKNEHK